MSVKSRGCFGGGRLWEMEELQLGSSVEENCESPAPPWVKRPGRDTDHSYAWV